MSTARRRRRVRLTALVLVGSVLGAVAIGGAAARAEGTPLALSVQAADAEVRQPRSLVPCADGGGSSVEQLGEAPLAPGVFSKLGGTVRLVLDVQPSGDGAAFLRPERSYVTITNQRGTVRLALVAGSCAAPTLDFDGTTVSGSGTWAVDPAYTTDAYADATGSGTFTLQAHLGRDGRHPWSLDLDGATTVRQPALSVRMVRSYWGRLGADYAGRTSSVIYRVTNTGPGESYRVSLLTATSTPGIEAVYVAPTALDDLSPGESIDVTVRWKVGVRTARGPVLSGRRFDTTLTFAVPDALDVTATVPVTVRVTSPAFPPSL